MLLFVKREIFPEPTDRLRCLYDHMLLMPCADIWSATVYLIHC